MYKTASCLCRPNTRTPSVTRGSATPVGGPRFKMFDVRALALRIDTANSLLRQCHQSAPPTELLSLVRLTHVVLHNRISLPITKRKRQAYLPVVSDPASAASSSRLIGLALNIETKSQHRRQSNKTKAYVDILSGLHLVKQPVSVCRCREPPRNSHGSHFRYDIVPLPKPRSSFAIRPSNSYSLRPFDRPYRCSPYVTIRRYLIPMGNNKLEI